MSSALTCQDAGFAGGQQQLYASTPRVSMDTLQASYWSGAPGNTPSCQEDRPALREGLSILTYDPVWNDQLSPHLQRNRQLQDTLVQREEELARLQEENNKLREFLNSSFVKNLEDKVKRLNAEGQRKLKRSLHADVADSLGTFRNLPAHQPVPPGSQRRVNKRVCRNLNFDFRSEEELTATASEPSSLDHWVLKTLGLKDRDTIDTTPFSSPSSSSAAEYSSSSSSSGYSHGSSFNPAVTPGRTAISSSLSSTAEYSLNATPYYSPLTATSSPTESHLDSASYNGTITSLSHTALSSSSSSEYSLNTASYDRTVDTAQSPTAVRNSDNYCQAAYGYGAPVDAAACRDVDVELSCSRGNPAFDNTIELSGSHGNPAFDNTVELSGSHGNPAFDNTVELSGSRGNPAFDNTVELSGSRGNPAFDNTVELSGSRGNPAFDNSVRSYSGSAGQCGNFTGPGSVGPRGPGHTVTNGYHPVTLDQSPATQPETTLFSTVLSKETAHFASPGRNPYARTPDPAQSASVFASSPVQSNHGGSGVRFPRGHRHHCHSPASGPPGGSAVEAPPHTPSPSTGRGRTDVAFSMSLSPSSSVRTHSFPQGQAFVRKDTEGRWNFTWVPKQGP